MDTKHTDTNGADLIFQQFHHGFTHGESYVHVGLGVLYLTPEGAPHVFRPPASALEAADSRLPDKKGHGFDGCSPRILMNRAEMKDGLIAFPGGTSYRLLVLPRHETMTPQLLAKIFKPSMIATTPPRLMSS